MAHGNRSQTGCAPSKSLLRVDTGTTACWLAAAASSISQIRFVGMNSLFNVKLNFPWQIVSPRYHSDEIAVDARMQHNDNDDGFGDVLSEDNGCILRRT